MLLLLVLLLLLQEENFDEALRSAFHAWTRPSIREWCAMR
jgi:hypothetical protein